MLEIQKNNFLRCVRGTDIAYCTLSEFNNEGWESLGWMPDKVYEGYYGVRQNIGGAVGCTDWAVYDSLLAAQIEGQKIVGQELN